MFVFILMVFLLKIRLSSVLFTLFILLKNAEVVT